MGVFAAGAAENLVIDGEIAKMPLSDEFRGVDYVGKGRLSQFEEPLYFNRCLRLEITGIADGPSVHIGIEVGGTKTKPGFPVKGDTEYEFSFELFGEAARCMSDYVVWDDSGKRVSKGHTSLGVLKPTKEWIRHSGTFRTDAGAKRAALTFVFWGRGRDFLEKKGDYIHIDKIIVREKTDSVLGDRAKTSADGLPLPADFAAKLAAVGPRTAAVVPSDGTRVKLSPFSDNKTEGRAAVYPAEGYMSADDEALTVEYRVPGKAKSVATKDGDPAFWKLADTVEFFLWPAQKGAKVLQCCVTPAGGRWMADRTRYGEWSAKCEMKDGGWRVVARFPWKFLGYARRPEAGTPVRFNIAHMRPVGLFDHATGKLDPAKENRRHGEDHTVYDSVWSFCHGEYRSEKEAGTVFIGDAGVWARREVGKLAEDEVRAYAKNLAFDDPAKLIGQVELLKTTDREMHLAREPFIVAQIPAHTETGLPFMPDELNAPQAKFTARSAVGGRSQIVLALANMRGADEDFMLDLSRGWAEQAPRNDRFYPLFGLKTEVGDVFPEKQIEILRGVRFRDADTERHGARFDPLERLSSTSTVTVPAKSCGLVWLKLNCTGVKPGVYRGELLVTRLSLGRTVENRHTSAIPQVKDDSKTFPIEVEVLPFELGGACDFPFNSFGSAFADYQHSFMDEYGITARMVSPWYFEAKFDRDGNLEKRRLRDFLPAALDRLAKTPRFGRAPRVFVCYSVASTFRRAWAKNLEYRSAAYWRAYRAWLAWVDETMRAHGIGNDDYSVEIYDEPLLSQVTAEEVAEHYREARQAVPAMRLLVTHGEEEFYETVRDLVDDYIFSHFSCGSPVQQPRIDDWKRRVKANPRLGTSVYACSTNMRQSHYDYYLLLPWKAYGAGGDSVSMYQLVQGNPGVSLRSSQYGSVVYDNGREFIPSTRFMNLMNGIEDVRYLKKLALLAGGDSKAAVEARAFIAKALKETAFQNAHDRTFADRMREACIERILKFEKIGSNE